MTALIRHQLEISTQAAIRPQLERADRLIWELLNPRTEPGEHDPDHRKFHRSQIYIHRENGEVRLKLVPIPPSEWWPE